MNQEGLLERVRAYLVPPLSVLICIFTVIEANRPSLEEASQRAIFCMLGLMLCFLLYPAHPKLKEKRWLRWVDLILVLGVLLCCGYIVVQTQPFFRSFWIGSTSLGDRAGDTQPLDFWVGVVGLVLVLEATRRSIGWIVPLLAVAALLYGLFRAEMPDWLFPFRSLSLEDVVASTFLKGQGVFGKPLGVMFKYVFLFVIFGAFLEITGAIQFIIDFSERLFGRTPGGPAKVSVLASGLMGSLSGSAVANAVTTGTFTIPMMRSAGFQPHVAAGITAAAASGGALVPPVMGAGAYMMLEFIEDVTFLQVATAAAIPAVLYYFSIFMIVHFYSRRMSGGEDQGRSGDDKELPSAWQILFKFEGVVFLAALTTLVVFLCLGRTPFMSVTLALLVIVVLGVIHPARKVTFRTAYEALIKSARNGVSLVAASACVGIVIGIVDATRVADAFGSDIKAVVDSNLFLALCGVMLCSIVLGMGVPSVVCYLLMATMMGSLLTQLDVPQLAAHLFIFYFGMMSMVTPPVALAAYASASLAQSKIMQTALAAFRFSLVGFTLPFMFVYQPALLFLPGKDGVFSLLTVFTATALAAVGILSLAASLAGYFKAPLGWGARGVLLLAAALLLSPNVEISGQQIGLVTNCMGAVFFVAVAALNWRTARSAQATA